MNKLLLVLSLFLFYEAQAQLITQYPATFISSSFNTFAQVNQIRDSESSKTQINSYVRKNTGIFSDVYQASMQMGFKYKNALLGTYAYTDRQGELIKKNRLYFTFSYQEVLSENLRGFIGFSAGFVNNSLGNEYTSSRGSASVWDLNVQTGFYNKYLFFSAAFKQIPQKIVTPILSGIQLQRFLEVYVHGNHKITRDIKLEYVTSGIIYSNLPDEYIGGLQLNWLKQHNVGFELSTYGKFHTFIDIQVLPNKEKKQLNLLIGFETNSFVNKHVREFIPS